MSDRSSDTFSAGVQRVERPVYRFIVGWGNEGRMDPNSSWTFELPCELSQEAVDAVLRVCRHVFVEATERTARTWDAGATVIRADAAKKLADAKAEIAALTEQRQSLRDENACLRNQCIETSKQSEARAHTINMIGNSLDDAERRNAELVKQVADKDDTICRLRRLNTEAVAVREAHQREAAELRSVVKLHVSDVSDYRGALDEAHKRLAEVTKQRDDYSSKVATLHAQLEALGTKAKEDTDGR